MRITLDTNILISAAFWYGYSHKIVEKVEKKELELILSDEIIKEFEEVLNYKEIQDKIKNKNLEMKLTVEKIRFISKIIEPKIKLDIVKDDSDDNKILECAKEGTVDFIITNDNHLLKLKEFENIEIMKPEDFIRIISKK